MKIAMIVRRLDVKGGTQRQALSLANELRRRGHAVKLYAFFYSRERCYTDLLEGFEVTALNASIQPAGYSALRRLPFLRYLATLWEIRHETRLARELAAKINRDVDLLNPHDRVAHRVAFFFKKQAAGSEKRPPSVWNTNDTHSIRWVMDKLADLDPAAAPSFLKRLGLRFRDWYENRRYIAAQDAIVVVDGFNKGLVEKYFGREAITVRNGPDLEYFTYRERMPPGARPKLLTSGIFFPHRRFEDAIQAVAMLRRSGFQPTLDIIGNPESDRPYAAKLERLVSELKLGDAVRFLGRVSEAELVAAYQNHDIYLYPHHLQSDGLSPFEALATGMAVVVSRGAGAHEVLTDRKTGLLVQPKSPGDIARAVRELMADPELYRRLSRDGADFVRSNFSWQRYADGMLRVYERALRSKPQ